MQLAANSSLEDLLVLKDGNIMQVHQYFVELLADQVKCSDYVCIIFVSCSYSCRWSQPITSLYGLGLTLD